MPSSSLSRIATLARAHREKQALKKSLRIAKYDNAILRDRQNRMATQVAHLQERFLQIGSVAARMPRITRAMVDYMGGKQSEEARLSLEDQIQDMQALQHYMDLERTLRDQHPIKLTADLLDGIDEDAMVDDDVTLPRCAITPPTHPITMPQAPQASRHTVHPGWDSDDSDMDTDSDSDSETEEEEEDFEIDTPHALGKSVQPFSPRSVQPLSSHSMKHAYDYDYDADMECPTDAETDSDSDSDSDTESTILLTIPSPDTLTVEHHTDEVDMVSPSDEFAQPPATGTALADETQAHIQPPLLTLPTPHAVGFTTPNPLLDTFRHVNCKHLHYAPVYNFF